MQDLDYAAFQVFHHTPLHGCEEKNAILIHTVFVETRCTSKLLQSEMCRSSTLKNVPVVEMGFNIPSSCVYTLL